LVADKMGLRMPAKARFRPGTRVQLESSIHRLKPLDGVKQLEPYFAHRIRVRAKLFRVLDSESNTFNRHSRLVRHLEFECRWS
jgi:hypothetical protein